MRSLASSCYLVPSVSIACTNTSITTAVLENLLVHGLYFGILMVFVLRVLCVLALFDSSVLSLCLVRFIYTNTLAATAIIGTLSHDF